MCTKGGTCNYVHPKLCNIALRTGLYYRVSCKFNHIAGTLREAPSTTTIKKHPNLMDISTFSPKHPSSITNVPSRQQRSYLSPPNQLAPSQPNHLTYSPSSHHSPDFKQSIPNEVQSLQSGDPNSGNLSHNSIQTSSNANQASQGQQPNAKSRRKFRTQPHLHPITRSSRENIPQLMAVNQLLFNLPLMVLMFS